MFGSPMGRSFGRDGSIYVQFPYLKFKSGILNELHVPHERSPVTYHLGEGGTEVPTDVKFSHHFSGEVRFSKTGYVQQAPRRTSFRLDGPIGHVFQLDCFWLSGFDAYDKPSKGSVHLGFDFPSRHATCFQIRGEWRRKSSIVENAYPVGGLVDFGTQIAHRKSGLRSTAYFIGQPEGYACQDHVLMITGAERSIPRGSDGPGMVFLGGWGPRGQAADSAAGCLAFLYPAGAAEGHATAT
ncbi:hypothetical protein [Gaopeijia maritima]|uniref:Uncharacterized protein n=1 Tax=Gaopeijia maritima TaxID=3119007 RepID=A0ABU9EC23_9BACT